MNAAERIAQLLKGLNRGVITREEYREAIRQIPEWQIITGPDGDDTPEGRQVARLCRQR